MPATLMGGFRQISLPPIEGRTPDAGIGMLVMLKGYTHGYPTVNKAVIVTSEAKIFYFVACIT